jgi:transposase-like protein
MLTVETIGRIRREFFVQGKTIKEIARDLRVSRNTVRKVVRSGATAFAYDRETQPRPKLGRWTADLEEVLAANVAKAAREQLTLIRIFEELRGRGYQGGYDAVRRYATRWSKTRGHSAAAAYVPLSFAPGEAYQFDWSHEVIVLNGHHGDREGRARAALSQPPAVRAPLSARDAGDGVRRARPRVRVLQGRLPARHVRLCGGTHNRRRRSPRRPRRR